MSASRLLLIGLPLGHALLFGGYFLWSGEPAGTAMSIIFAIAMFVMLWALLPTLGDVGPTAPVDPEWHERTQAATYERVPEPVERHED